ncbi:hypothetical protein AB9M62_18890 [Bacillales bacterium AN1005]
MIILLISLFICLIIGIASILFIKSKIYKNDIDTIIKLVDSLKEKDKKQEVFHFLFLSYESRNFKEMDDYLNKSNFSPNQKYYVIFFGPDWMYEIRKKKWTNHEIFPSKLISNFKNLVGRYELVIYQKQKESVKKFETALPIIECMKKVV